MRSMFLVVLFIIFQNVCISIQLTKTVIITGANRGVGLSALKNLLSDKNQKYNIIMACRSVDNAKNVVEKIQLDSDGSSVDILYLDLSDLKSVKDFALQLKNKPIDCLALNAGIQTGSNNKKDAPISRTTQGFESTIGTNHIGHFYLLKLLLPNLKKSKSGRVVFVGSGVHNPDEPGGDVGSKATLGDMQGLLDGFKDPISMIDGGSYDPDKAYKDSKLCNVMTSLELAKRLKKENSKVTCNVMNPGLIPTTGLFREFNPVFVFIFTILTRYVFKVASSEEEGGKRLAYLISSDEVNGINGKYFSGKPGKSEFNPITASVEARDEKKSALLWSLTEKLLNNNKFN